MSRLRKGARLPVFGLVTAALAGWLLAVTCVAVGGAVSDDGTGPAEPAPRAAWADNPTNEAVPTDDTGVVDPNAGKDKQPEGNDGNSSGAGAGSDANAGTVPPAGPAPQSGDGAAPDGSPAPPAEGEDATASEGADAAEGDKPVAPPVLPDPVFGEGTNPDNLINPQQKPDSSFIYDTSISALQDADSYLNNQTVQVTGEVVGDRIKAEFDPGFCWIVLQANDDSYAEVPVFIATDVTAPIDTYGSYGRKGTTLQVRGIFHLSCSDHEGLTDLHADTVAAVEKGSITQQTLDPKAFIPGGILTVLGLVMLLVFRHMREGRR